MVAICDLDLHQWRALLRNDAVVDEDTAVSCHRVAEMGQDGHTIGVRPVVHDFMHEVLMPSV